MTLGSPAPLLPSRPPRRSRVLVLTAAVLAVTTSWAGSVVAGVVPDALSLVVGSRRTAPPIAEPHFLGWQPGWPTLPGRQGRLTVGFRQTAELLDDPDVPPGGGEREYLRVLWAMESTTVTAGETLELQIAEEWQIPLVDYRPDGTVRCPRFGGDLGWGAFASAGLGGVSDGSSRLGLVGLYPEDRSGALPDRPAEIEVPLDMPVPPHYEVNAGGGSCYEVDRTAYRVTVTIPPETPPGRYRLAVGSPPRLVNVWNYDKEGTVLSRSLPLVDPIAEGSLPGLTVVD